MKKIFLVLLSAGVLVTTGCSRSDNKAITNATPTATPDAVRLKSESERLQQATANAAKARENAATMSPTPSATP